MGDYRLTLRRAMPLALLALAGAYGTAAAQKADAWELYAKVGLETGYNDNVFLLSPGQKNKLEGAQAALGGNPPPGVTSNGPFADMESIDDIVTAVGALIGLQGPGLSGRRLRVLPSFEYVHYVQNARRRHVTVGLALVQALPSRQRLRLQAEVRPQYFQRNYLADAVDGDGNGNIEPDERIYSAGEFRRSGVALDYRARVARSRGRALDVELAVGYEVRNYQAPFSVRDRSGPTAGATINAFLANFGVEVSYVFAAPSTTPAQEVLLLDESLFGVDFNGNGNATDSLARAFELVDRSRSEHVLGLAANIRLGRKTVLSGLYQYRIRDYSSQEPFDVSHNGRRDNRSRYGGRLTTEPAKRLELMVRADYSKQTSNRPGDPGSTGEIDDYNRYRGSIGASYRF